MPSAIARPLPGPELVVEQPPSSFAGGAAAPLVPLLVPLAAPELVPVAPELVPAAPLDVPPDDVPPDDVPPDDVPEGAGHVCSVPPSAMSPRISPPPFAVVWMLM